MFRPSLWIRYCRLSSTIHCLYSSSWKFSNQNAILVIYLFFVCRLNDHAYLFDMQKKSYTIKRSFTTNTTSIMYYISSNVQLQRNQIDMVRKICMYYVHNSEFCFLGFPQKTDDQLTVYDTTFCEMYYSQWV